MTHTSGPWRVQPDLSNIGRAGVTTANGEYEFGVNCGYEPGYMCVEDARLIAASPRLLAALRALVAAVERDDNPRDEGHCEHSEEMQEARAAIAEATGQ